ncbi:MAG: hypothetical protein ACLUEK_09395 [Oscillospiraceae bacterium]
MDSAKLLIIIFIVALIILIAGAAIWFGWGGTGAEWYSQIDNTCVRQVNASDDMIYKYTLTCYDAEGHSRRSLQDQPHPEGGRLHPARDHALRGVVSGRSPRPDLPAAVQACYPAPAIAA